MFEFEIGGNEIPPEASEGISLIPSNRSLLVLGLTVEPAATPELVYGLKTVDDVFKRFQPSVEVKFTAADESTTTEVLKFANLGDFQATNLANNSDFLGRMSVNREEYKKIEVQLKTDKTLQKVLADTKAKAEMLTLLKALHAELQLTIAQE